MVIETSGAPVCRRRHIVPEVTQSVNIVFLDKETFPSYVCFPRPDYPHRWRNYDHTTPDQTGPRIREAHIVIVNKVTLTAAQLAQASSLRLIALIATGSNNLDLDYCRAQGIAVANIRNYGSHSVAEHTLALILTLKRRLLAYNRRIAAGQWQQHRQFVLFDEPVADLNGAILGIVGRGTLGARVAQLGRALGMKVLFAERKQAKTCRPTHSSFYQVVQRSDVLSLHCPLTPENARLMGEKEFGLMKKTALFINTARGPLMDEVALAHALVAKEIAGAGLDVLALEPPSADNPLLALASRPNLLITPHTAWTSIQAMNNAVQQTMENIVAFLNNRPIRLIS